MDCRGSRGSCWVHRQLQHGGHFDDLTNTKKTPPKPDPDPDPSYPLDVVVRKVWSSDDMKDRPDSVTVTLYNGDVPYETVRLGAWNNWTYTWKDLSAYGNCRSLRPIFPRAMSRLTVSPAMS